MYNNQFMGKSMVIMAGLGLLLGMVASPAMAQAPLGHEAFGFYIYAVNPGFYPIVQAYVRTFDHNMEPVKNINLMNIGIQVDGRNYDPARSFDMASRRGMYGIETLQNRNESFRTVIIWDCSKSMAGGPFNDARTAIQRYIQVKRPSDEIAIIAIRDTNTGYQIVSNFEKDPVLLNQRIADVECDGMQTRLYDSVVAALQMCASVSQGGINSTDPDFAVLNIIVALSDGHDEGSSISKDALLTRLSNMAPPVPIYSLGYANPRYRDSLINMEALSTATFGRYWNIEESQNFSGTLQKIHEINRSDYVVTFRSTSQDYGRSHSFGIGIEWPSGSGRWQHRQGAFTAMESPALLIGGRPKEMWDRLNEAYPDVSAMLAAAVPSAAAPPFPVPDGAPPVMPQPADFGGATPPVEAMPPVQQDIGAQAVETSGAADSFEIRDIALVGAIGVAILFMIIAVLMWVRSNSVARMARQNAGSGTTTKPPSHP